MRKNMVFIFAFFVLSIFHFIKPAYYVSGNETPPFSSKNLDIMNNVNYTQTKPNESGQIMILMYHGIDKNRTTANYSRTVKGFKEDLQKLYDNNYRLITMEDLINNDISVEAGFSPVVLTFDDALSTAFSLEESDGELVPKENCAVDIINKFSEEHPDFGKGGVFFISVKGRPPFFGKGEMKERLQYLLDNGYEIGNHTFSHPHFYRLSREKIEEELVLVENFIHEIMPEATLHTMAYPFGERPKKEIGDAVLNGEFENTEYHYKIALREGQSGASANPNNINFDPLNIPRVRGTNNAKMDLGWSIKYYNQYPEKRYISDGNPDTISVPIQHLCNIDMQSIGDKELIIYDQEDK